MADRISQLQFKMNELADHMCNAVGVLQQSSRAVADAGGAGDDVAQQRNEDLATLFGQLIARSSRDIETLIDALPSDELTPDLQAKTLVSANTEGLQTAEKLRQVTDRGDQLLARIRDLLHLTATAIIETRKVQAHLKGDFDDELDEENECEQDFDEVKTHISQNSS